MQPQDPNSEPDPEEPRSLKFLRRLVTLLTATMIAGVLVIIVLIVMRFYDVPPPLPDRLTLPDGVGALAFTQGPDWYAVVTTDDRILIYDRVTGDLRQTVVVERP